MSNQPNMISYIESGIRGEALKKAVIARNIAHMGAPEYRRQAVNFHKLLAKAMENGKQLDMSDVNAMLFRPMDTPLDANGNDVDMEVEIGSMVQNDAMLKTYLRVLGKLYSQMEMAIGG